MDRAEQSPGGQSSMCSLTRAITYQLSRSCSSLRTLRAQRSVTAAQEGQAALRFSEPQRRINRSGHYPTNCKPPVNLSLGYSEASAYLQQPRDWVHGGLAMATLRGAAADERAIVEAPSCPMTASVWATTEAGETQFGFTFAAGCPTGTVSGGGVGQCSRSSSNHLGAFRLWTPLIESSCATRMSIRKLRMLVSRIGSLCRWRPADLKAFVQNSYHLG